MKEKLLKLLKKGFLVEILKYLLVGGFCTLVDFIILYLLINVLEFNNIIASAISFSIAVIINYILCTYWIFKTNTVSNKGKEFLFYLIISLVGLILNSGLIGLLTLLFPLGTLISKVLVTPVVLVWNFLARKLFLHTDKLNKKDNE